MNTDASPTPVSSVLRTTEEAAASYDKVKDDKNLSSGFHASGRALGPIQAALGTIESTLQNETSPLSSESEKLMTDCGDGMKKILKILDAVAQKSGPERLEAYGTALQQLNQGMGLEISVINIIEKVLELAKDSVLKGPMEEEVKRLVHELSKMKLLASEDIPAYINSGSGYQFISGGGPQKNNTGSGNQFNDTPFHGTVHFNNGNGAPQS